MGFINPGSTLHVLTAKEVEDGPWALDAMKKTHQKKTLSSVK